MARVRSPAYPAHNLSEVIEYTKKIHDADRQHPVPREIAAHHMGFSGITGTSDRALSSLFHYGLAEKVAKGEIRITDLALRIIHPESEDERRGALNDAAFSPQLFQELRRRYPDRPPTSATLGSFLSREGFASAAINPASKAFLETCRFLQQEGAYESDGDGVEVALESVASVPVQENKPVQHAPIITPSSAPSGVALRQDIFTLQGGGFVTASLPESLSKQEYEDLKDWLELMQRKAERKIVVMNAGQALIPQMPDSSETEEFDPSYR